jgi:hypothetical protein
LSIGQPLACGAFDCAHAPHPIIDSDGQKTPFLQIPFAIPERPARPSEQEGASPLAGRLL